MWSLKLHCPIECPLRSWWLSKHLPTENIKTAEIVKGNKHYNIHPRAELKTIVNYNLGLKGSKTFVNGRTTVVLWTTLLKPNLKTDFGTRLRYGSFLVGAF